MKVLKFITEMFRKYPGLVSSNIVAAIIVNLLAAVSVCALTPLIDSFLYPDGHGHSSLTLKVTGVLKALGIPATLMSLVLVFVTLFILTAVVQVYGNWLMLRTKSRLSQDLMTHFLQDVFQAKWLFFTSTEQGKTLNSLNRELVWVGDAFNAIGTIFSNSVQIMIFLTIPLYISWKVTLLCLSSGGIAALLFIFLSRFSYKLGQRGTQTGNDLAGFIFESIGGAKLILGYGEPRRTVEKINAAYDAHLKYYNKAQLLIYSMSMAYRPIGVVIVLVALLTSRAFGVPASELAILLLSLLQIANAFSILLSNKTMISSFIPAYEQIQSLRASAQSMKQVSGQVLFKGFSRCLLLEEVSFSYPERPPALTRISLKIPKGKVVAFIGKSGSGKSTLIDILMGLHSPTQGRVLVDDIPMADLDINSYRRRVGYVPQESILFNMTVKENILWSKPDATDDEIKQACHLAYADEFIANFPKGYDTFIGDRGVRLSGGQIQRLALARALVRRPEILFLDEATSSLDSYSEGLIQKAIEALSGKTTMVIVAHRLATIKKADLIYVFDKGALIESGQYEQLCQQGGPFSDLVRFQELGIH